MVGGVDVADGEGSTALVAVGAGVESQQLGGHRIEAERVARSPYPVQLGTHEQAVVQPAPLVGGQRRTGQQHRDIEVQAVLVGSAAHRAGETVERAEGARPAAHGTLLLVGGEQPPPLPRQVGRRTSCGRAGPDPGSLPRHGEQWQQGGEVALACVDRAPAGARSRDELVGCAEDSRRGEPRVLGDPLEHLAVPVVQNRQFGLLLGPDVLHLQPAERSDRLGVAVQPAGLPALTGDQVVVLAAQDVDRRAGLADHVRVDPQVFRRAVQRLDQPAQQFGAVTELGAAASCRVPGPGVRQQPGVVRQVVGPPVRRGRHPGAPGGGARDDLRVVGRIGQPVRSAHRRLANAPSTRS